MIRIALYLRAATESVDMAAQERSLRAAVADLPGSYVITRLFRDSATSGLTLDRSGLDDLLGAAAAREIDVVMVTGHERLSRSYRDLAYLRQMLAVAGVRVTTPEEEREPSFAALIHQFSTLAAS